MAVVIGIGTLKGAWFARSDDRRTWELDGPHLKGWEVSTFGRAPGGDHLLGTGSSWFGGAVHRSSDLSRWEQIVDGPAYGEESGRKMDRVWTLATVGDRVYAGVAEAGLFASDDDGTSWAPVAALNDHESAGAWQPGFGGLCAHRILADPDDPARVWVGISAVGVFASEDRGASWELRNAGLPQVAPTEGFDIGYCVHSIVADPSDADLIWRQDHSGVFRTSDGGRSWERIQNGIPGSGFGFPIVRDAASGSLFVVPLEADQYRAPVDGLLRVYRSTDGGDSWHATGPGLPDHPVHTGVLRDAMDVDGLDTGGVYFGTTGGEVWISPDTGESWERLPATFPRITSIKVLEAA
jgi:photosystem II stability/assembly factor-like uncharacterized protein